MLDAERPPADRAAHVVTPPGYNEHMFRASRRGLRSWRSDRNYSGVIFDATCTFDSEIAAVRSALRAVPSTASLRWSLLTTSTEGSGRCSCALASRR